MNDLRVPYLHEGKQTHGANRREYMCMGRFRLKLIGAVHSDITLSKMSGCWAVCIRGRSTVVRSRSTICSTSWRSSCKLNTAAVTAYFKAPDR